jgi:hypothetical protein
MPTRTSLKNLFALLFLSGFLLAAVPQQSFADDGQDNSDQLQVHVPDSKNQIMKFTDDGVQPAEIHMRKEDSIVFFLNDSTDSLATLTVDFGKRTTHCATANLKIRDNGLISSIRPIEPRNFASVCFHDAGTYPVTVYGLKKKPEGIQASIVVQ